MNVETKRSIAALLPLFFVALGASAQDSSINVQCPTSTTLHPSGTGIRCGHLVAGDGMVTMADDAYANDDGTVGGKKTYIFSFAWLPNEGALPNQGTTWPPGPERNSPAYPGWVMDQGMLAANAPAPTIEVDEDDEVFLSLTNVGMAMRPDLFDPHTVHWHGFPNAASVFDGVPDSSISINMGATLAYYYLAKDAGTYMYHCHVEAAEHMQMGMLGNLFVRPRQNRTAAGMDLGVALKAQQSSTPMPAGADPTTGATGVLHVMGNTYAYNDGDGSTRYDVSVPILIGSFDPDFHDASLNVQPLPFAGMRDRYFLLNGRGYPDTVNPAVLSTEDPTGKLQPSQPVSTLITATPGQRILLRIANLSVTEFYTLGFSGPSMQVVALDARLLRDGAGNTMYYRTNSLTLGGGQSADVIVDTTGLAAGSTYFLYTTNLDRLANDAENFGGMMTEIRIN